MFKYETHCHTSEGSACGYSTASEMVQKYAELGYSGIIITDHFFNGNTTISREGSWESRVDALMKSYDLACEEAKKCGIDVFFGFEYSCFGNDYITVGLGREWLKMHPEIMDMKLTDYLKFARSEGGFIIHAHPFRQEWYVDLIRLTPELEDAVEVFNFGNNQQIFNDRAKWYAESFNLPMTGGSDAHNVNSCKSGIEVPERAENIQHLCKMISEKKALPIYADKYE